LRQALPEDVSEEPWLTGLVRTALFRSHAELRKDGFTAFKTKLFLEGSQTKLFSDRLPSRAS